jgi:chromosome partitioning protein
VYTVTATSLKGGSGKTNFCAAASVEFERLGFGPVALIDTDPQGSLSDWWNARESPTPQFAAVDIRQLSTHLKSLQNDGINLTIIDTPPAMSNVIHAAIAASDLVVVPVRPSPSDLRAVGAIVNVIEAAGKDFIFVINAATPRTKIAMDALKVLAEYGKVSPAILHNRIDFAVSMIDGRTVGELDKKSKSAQEITLLAKYVYKQLTKKVGA